MLGEDAVLPLVRNKGAAIGLDVGDVILRTQRRLANAKVTSGSHKQATSISFFSNSWRAYVKSSIENLVDLRTSATCSRVKRELVIMNSNTV